MLFNSIAFLFFLPTVLLGIGLLPKKARNPALVVASYFFYGCWDWRFTGLLMLSTIIDYNCSLRIHASNDPIVRKRFVTFSVCANLAILGSFKYFNFFVDTAAVLLETLGFHASMPSLQIILPVGISFYTFQTMAYTIDVYRRQAVPTTNFVDFALYTSYFPQLVAGPIERARNLLPQIASPAKVTPDRISIGLILMMVGFVKKVLIADNIAPVVDPIFASPEEMSAGDLWRGAYLFVFQVYCDFSGYSDIARGVSELLGIRLMVNFQHPYVSQSMTEFWRRWHISFSTWLRDYVYFPLGGNRRGDTFTYINLMITMIVSGLWHGASWTFVVWGAMNGFYLGCERALGIGKDDPRTPDSIPGWVARFGRTIFTMHAWMFLLIPFRSLSFGNMFDYYVGMFTHSGGSLGPWPFIAAAAIYTIDLPQHLANDHTVFLRMPTLVQVAIYTTLILAILLYGGQPAPFVYFQF